MENRKSRWYFGGVSAAGATLFTHPFDLLKVQLQTQKGGSDSVVHVTKKIISEQSVLSLYNGLSAALLRQLTYSSARFGIYETGKQRVELKTGVPMSFAMSALLASVAGAAGGFLGTPADLVNVRMQNDIKLPPGQRRNYRHAVHGLAEVVSKEGGRGLWAGTSVATARAVFVTVGQVAFYDQVKQLMLSTPHFQDNIFTHLSASIIAGSTATLLTQPLDVLKTRAMNAPPDEKASFIRLMLTTAREGPLAFYKGFIPAFIRLGPHTVLTFVFMEQLRMKFGILPSNS